MKEPSPIRHRFGKWVPIVALSLPIMLLVVFQGGFFAMPACVLGLVLCAAAGVHYLRKASRSVPVGAVPLLFCGMAAAYLVSATLNGLSITTMGTTGGIAACAGFACLACAQSSKTQGRAINALGWFGVITSVGGVLVAAGLWPMVGGMVESRLQFSFQYANAAAAWYGACTLLCLLSPNERLNACVALPGTALLLTLSGGGLMVFGASFTCVSIVWLRSGRWDRLFGALVQAVIAVALFVATYVLGGAWAIAALVAALAACVWVMRNDVGNLAVFGVRTTSIALLIALLLGVVAATMLLSGRIAQALASVTERGYHIRDGLCLWSSAPIFGVGPSNWQYLYQYVQTAPYHTTIVHSSLVQFMLDAGLVGFACFAAAMVLGVRQAWQAARVEEWQSGWAAARLAAALSLLIYAFIEFDLQFSALLFLLVLLVCQSATPCTNEPSAIPDATASAGTRRLPRPKGAILGVLSLLLVPLCAAGVLCGLTSTAMTSALAAGDYDMCERLFQSSAFAQADTTAQGQYLTAQYERGNYGYAIDAFYRMPAPSDADALFAVLSCYRQGDVERATAIMAERLEVQPYNVDFCASARQLVDTYGCDMAQEARFEAAAQTVETNAARFEEVS